MGSPEPDFVIVEKCDVTDLARPGQQSPPSEDLQHLRAWLKPTKYSGESSEYHRHIQSYVSGTASWMHEPQYQQWIGPYSNGPLWIKAVSGAGKSVAAAHLIACSAARPETVVLYFFFRQIVASNREPAALLRDWIAQALPHSPELQVKVKACCDKGATCEEVPFEELWQKLTIAFVALPSVICVVDALDEMSIGHEDFLEKLGSLGAMRPATVKIFLTSRPVPRFMGLLKTPFICQLTLSTTLLREPLAIYIEDRLANLNLPRNVHGEIKQGLMHKSDGLFLYMKLMMDELLAKSMLEATSILENLAGLPKGLSEAYTRMLSEHSSRSKVPQSLQIAMLRWVTHSARPLRVLELVAIVDSLTTNDLLEDVPKLRATYDNTKAMIRVACGPLIEILPDDSVSIIHHSLTEYVVDSARNEGTVIEPSTVGFPVIGSDSSHKEMAITCLQELTSDWAYGLDIKADAYYWDATSPVGKYIERPFLKYASNYWLYHLRRVKDEDATLVSLLDVVLNPLSDHFNNWRYLSHTNFPTGTTALHFAAQEALSCYISYLLRCKLDVNARDGNGQTPLWLAASSGHTEVVLTLLSNRSDPMIRDGTGNTPLHLAAENDHSGVVRAFLEAGVSPVIPQSKGNQQGPDARSNPVQRAFKRKHGDPETAMAFVPYLKRSDLYQAVFWAAEKRRSNVVTNIMKSCELDVNTILEGESLVFVAVSNHDSTLLEGLLELGAHFETPKLGSSGYVGKPRLDIECNPQSTLLHAFARGCLNDSSHNEAGREKGKQVLEILLEGSLDINAKDSDGQTPLHIAINADRWDRKADPVLIKLFLERGADACAKRNDGFTTLHLEWEGVDIAKLLLEYGADVNARDFDYQKTPLHRCIEQNQYSIDRFNVLIENGADYNTVDTDGNTPLHYVTRDHSYKDAELRINALLDRGADAKARNVLGETPLHKMISWNGNKNLVPILINAGADIGALDIEGKTALMHMREESNEPQYAVIDAMLSFGADINARDHAGRTFLHHVCMKPLSARMVPDLVKRGAKIDAVDFAGNTVLHYLARLLLPDKLLESSINLGVDPNARNQDGQAPLHIVAGSRADTIWKAGLDPVETLSSPDHNPDINAVDNAGNSALHLAATLSDQCVATLISKGANPCLVNYDGQTLLHIASRARESNTVGLICSTFASRDKDLIHYSDCKGRTALHYACRSGRVESVRYLLEAGADPNCVDHEGLTPLCTCVEFQEEQLLWRLATQKSSRSRFMDAAGMSPFDPQRPRRPRDIESDNQLPHSSHTDRSDNDDFVGIRPITRLLFQYGANVSPGRGSHRARYAIDARVHAIEQSCDVLLDELLIQKAEVAQVQLSPRQTYLEQTLRPQSLTSDESFGPMFASMKNSEMAGSRNLIAGVLGYMLQNEKEDDVVKLYKHVKESPASADEEDLLTTLIKYGYSELLSQILPQASTIAEPVNFEGSSPSSTDTILRLRQACARHIPNIEVLKVLVEEKHYNVNVIDQNGLSVTGKAPLHVLAESSHWWKAQAIKYLAQTGASLDAKDENGNTPLHVAIAHKALGNAETLLQCGADPDAVSNSDMTCLNKAASSLEMIRLLLAHGASVTGGRYPFIFEAIHLMDFGLLSSIVSGKVDLSRGFKAEARTGRWDNRPLKYVYRIQLRDLDVVYPLHFAASQIFNQLDKREKMIPIIELLMEHGADPWRECSEGHMILHELCKTESIVEPILSFGGLDLEHRDAEGNTLLLAACCARTTQSSRDIQSLRPLTALLLEKGACIGATDDHGRNALHSLFACQQGIYYRDAALLERDLKVILGVDGVASIINQRDDQGMTPLFYALGYYPPGEIDVFVDMLLAHGADPFVVDHGGNTALHIIARKLGYNPYLGDGPTDTFIKLLNLGLKINTRNKDSKSIIFTALNNNYLSPNGLRFFLENGANLRDTSSIGQNLLHVVASKPPRRDFIFAKEEREADVESWKFLIGEGLDPADEDGEMRSAWDLAVAVGNRRILELVGDAR